MPAGPETLVLVHGAVVNGSEMFLLRHRLRRLGYRVRQFHYHSMLRGMKENLRFLRAFIQSTPGETLHAIGHSMGGILLRHAFEKDSDPRPGRLIALGSPFLDCWVARRIGLLHRYSHLLHGKTVRDHLNHSRDPLWHGAREFGIIAGTYPFGLGRAFRDLPLPHDGIIRLEETRLGNITDHVTYNLNHFSLLASRRCTAQMHRFLQHGSFQHPSRHARMKLEEQIIQSPSGEYARKVWLLPPPRGTPEKIALFLDGEYYVQQMKAPAILLRLQKRGKIPPMFCAFVSHLDHESRHRDLTCNPRYADFIATDLLRSLREKFPAIPQQNLLIAGASLSGLTAAWLALTHPHLFPWCLCQSGSFWWNDEWLTKNLPQMPPGQTKFWLSVGHKETESNVTHGTLRQDASQISACARLAAALKARGHPIHHDIYRGGHDIKPWKKELPEALIWLLAPP